MVAVTQAYYGTNWWHSPGYAGRIEWLLSLPEEKPELADLAYRLLHAPWQLSDAQALWLIRHHYDYPPAAAGANGAL